jgi:hypothetical protein
MNGPKGDDTPREDLWKGISMEPELKRETYYEKQTRRGDEAIPFLIFFFFALVAAAAVKAILNLI